MNMLNKCLIKRIIGGSSAAQLSSDSYHLTGASCVQHHWNPHSCLQYRSVCIARIQRGSGIWLICLSRPWGRNRVMLIQKKLISKPVTEECYKYQKATCLLIGFSFSWLSVVSCYPLSVTLYAYLRDDNFSDTLSQKADSEASSGHAGEDKCFGKDTGSPTDNRISEAYISRLVFMLL